MGFRRRAQVAGFLQQLAAGAVDGILFLLQSAGRKLDEHLIQSVTQVADQQHLLLVQDRDNDHSAGMDDDLFAETHAFGHQVVDLQPYAIALVENLLLDELVFHIGIITRSLMWINAEVGVM